MPYMMRFLSAGWGDLFPRRDYWHLREGSLPIDHFFLPPLDFQHVSISILSLSPSSLLLLFHFPPRMISPRSLRAFVFCFHCQILDM
jgi:hypothetical protein